MSRRDLLIMVLEQELTRPGAAHENVANPQDFAAINHIEWAHHHPAEFRQWFQSKFPERFAHLQEYRRQSTKFDEARRTLIAALERELVCWGGCP